jgi:ribokinase
MHQAPRIAAIGQVSLDTMVLARGYPLEGAFTLVDWIEQMPGGTTATSAVVAARLGAKVAFIGRIGADPPGESLRLSLSREGIDVASLEVDSSTPTDETMVIVSSPTGERTIFRKQGARIARGARLDIDALFGNDIVLLDVADLSLYRFLVDLPVHTKPNAQLLGTLTYLAGAPELALSDILPRLDAVVGSARDAMAVTNTSSLAEALACLQNLVRGSNLRFAAVTDRTRGAFGITAGQVLHVASIDVLPVDSMGAGDAFAGALAFALASRWGAHESLQVCSVTAGLSTTRYGAQSGLPTMDAVREVLDDAPPHVAEVIE